MGATLFGGQNNSSPPQYLMTGDVLPLGQKYPPIPHGPEQEPVDRPKVAPKKPAGQAYSSPRDA
jgi:hypothetical protein